VNQSGLLSSKNSRHKMLDTAGILVAAIWRSEPGSAVSNTLASSILSESSIEFPHYRLRMIDLRIRILPLNYRRSSDGGCRHNRRQRSLRSKP